MEKPNRRPFNPRPHTPPNSYAPTRNINFREIIDHPVHTGTYTTRLLPNRELLNDSSADKSREKQRPVKRGPASGRQPFRAAALMSAITPVQFRAIFGIIPH